jgi:hypothetical protein
LTEAQPLGQPARWQMAEDGPADCHHDSAYAFDPTIIHVA